MRALSFFFALLVGLALACIAPAMAGGRGQAPEATMAPEAAMISTESTDRLATDRLAADLFAELNVDMAPVLDASA